MQILTSIGHLQFNERNPNDHNYSKSPRIYIKCPDGMSNEDAYCDVNAALVEADLGFLIDVPTWFTWNDGLAFSIRNHPDAPFKSFDITVTLKDAL